MGDGSSALTSAATAVFLDEFSTTGTSFGSLALPTAANGANHRFADSGSATSDGMLTLSTDSLYLTLAGYDAALGTASVASTPSASNPRTFARVDWTKTASGIDTTTALTSAYSANNVRSVVWDAANSVFDSAGAGTATDGGVRESSLGGSSSSLLSGSLINARVANIFGGSLYASTGSGTNTFKGVSQISGGTATRLNGFTDALAPSSYDFYFASATTLYVADDSTNTNGGIQKWTSDGSTWTRQYVLRSYTTGGVFGARGLTGVTDANGVTTLYATTAETAANHVISLVDTGPGASADSIATAATNEIFRGVDFAPQAVPEPASMAVLGLGLLGVLRMRRRKA